MLPSSTGSPTSAHWISQPGTTDIKTESLGITTFPIWSAQTFSEPAAPSNKSNTVNQPTITINGENVDPPDSDPPNSDPPDSNTKARSKIQPKRVAPPPPKGKKHKRKGGGEVEESAVYEVPAGTSRWFSKKRRPPKMQYKELNLNQVEAPSSYAKPQTAT